MVADVALKADIVRPSALRPSELAVWRHMQAGSRSLQRAFLSPGFAQACERAHGRAYVAVLHEAGAIRGFFPFQFRSFWHERLAAAERIGGALCDAAGVIADADLRINSAALMRLCGLGSLFMTHLTEDQRRFGLAGSWPDVGYVIDPLHELHTCFATVPKHVRDFMRDTERRLRRARQRFGSLAVVRIEQITSEDIAALIEQKRRQYRRTQVGDVFSTAANVRVIEALNESPGAESRLVLHRLQAGDRTLAQHLGPQHHDVLSYWFPVYDPQARELSPGRLLLWLTIQRAGQDGIGLIDRGAGDTPYKRALASGTIRYGRAHWFGTVGRSVPARAWQSLEWRWRAWRRGTRTTPA